MTAQSWNVSVLQRSLAPDWRVVSMEYCSLSGPGAGRVGGKEGREGGKGNWQGRGAHSVSGLCSCRNLRFGLFQGPVWTQGWEVSFISKTKGYIFSVTETNSSPSLEEFLTPPLQVWVLP